ncbi:MAG TPA: M23 family metallopeptidase [Nannocystaceae bacterium]|nr:M23 family metallopeptidase [Nannocystaceae bacterium]
MRATIIAVLASLAVAGTATASPKLVETLQRELGLSRSATEVRKGLAELDREHAGLQYTASLLEHASDESLRRLTAYTGGMDEREASVRARGRALYKLARGGAARLAFGEPLGDDEQGSTADRLRRARALRGLVRHDLHELASHRRARARARAELLAATREHQALAAAQGVLAMESTVLEQASSLLDPAVAQAMRARTHALARADVRTRFAERELIDRVKNDARALAELRGNTGSHRLVRPVRGRTIGAFGRYLDRVLAVPMLRNGIELAATNDEPVFAVADGRVALVTDLPEYGGAVVIDHGDGQLSMVARLWKIGVAIGDEVDEGALLGHAAPKAIDDGLGRTVYFELRHGERPVDPEPWLQRPASARPRRAAPDADVEILDEGDDPPLP